ncbi:MAG TPA: hypothetical protein VFC63_10675 [Blastocatellia bacterium]|nr:hypothetical protein [Blastocatellia bacterium]
MNIDTDTKLDAILKAMKAEMLDDLRKSEPLVSTPHMKAWYRYDMTMFDIGRGDDSLIVVMVEDLNAFREKYYLQRRSVTDTTATVDTPQGKISMSFPEEYDEFMLLMDKVAGKMKESERRI